MFYCRNKTSYSKKVTLHFNSFSELQEEDLTKMWRDSTIVCQPLKKPKFLSPRKFVKSSLWLKSFSKQERDELSSQGERREQQRLRRQTDAGKERERVLRRERSKRWWALQACPGNFFPLLFIISNYIF